MPATAIPEMAAAEDPRKAACRAQTAARYTPPAMTLISRYVLRELLLVFSVALGALTLFMMVVGLVREAQQQGLGLAQILMLVPYVLPEAMRFAVPGTMLFAAASVFGRMSASNEITALRAAGITPLCVIWPAAGLALVVSFVSVWLNDVAVSWGRDGVRRVVVESVEQIIYGRLRQQRSYSTPHMAINVRAVDGRRLIRPTLSLAHGPGGAPVTVSAAEAELRANAAAETLVVTFRDGTLHMGDVTASFPDTIVRELPLGAVTRKGTRATSPSEIPMAEFARAHTEQVALIEQLDQAAAGKRAMALFAGALESAMPAAVAGEQAALSAARGRLNRIVLEPWRRWANGFSCRCFVLIGAPMAIRMRNADFLTSFFLCFLPILVVYYPVFILGVDLAKRGAVPPIAVWLGNLLVVLWGWWLLRRVVRA